MGAIRKIEAALAAGPTEGEWSVPHYSRDDVDCNCTSVLSETYCGAIATIHFHDGKSIADGGGDDPIPSEAKANGMMIAACSPAAIREVLQTLASKEAELVRLKTINLKGPDWHDLLSQLVAALDNSFISSWQSTAGWQKELDQAQAALSTTQPPKKLT